MTMLCLMSPVSLLICLSVLCALLIVGVCFMAVLVAKNIIKHKKMTENDVYIVINDDKIAVSASIAENNVNKTCELGEVEDGGAEQ